LSLVVVEAVQQGSVTQDRHLLTELVGLVAQAVRLCPFLQLLLEALSATLLALVEQVLTVAQVLLVVQLLLTRLLARVALVVRLLHQAVTELTELTAQALVVIWSTTLV
jgi:hypothetical protein